MNCEKTFDLIDDLAENELDGQTAARVESHVSACPKCLEYYEVLQREKAVFAHYLFDAEPPSDLRANFQRRLAAEQETTVRVAETPAPASFRKTDLFGFLRWSPALAGAALLVGLGIGFGWLKFVPEAANKDEYVAETKIENSQPAVKSGESDEIETTNLPAKIESGAEKVAAQNTELVEQSDFLKTKNAVADRRKSMRAGALKIRPKTVFQRAKENSTAENESNTAEKLLKSRMENLEAEIAGQIERVELLLRSFRNARTAETVETFDIEYEKGQARKLLGKNARLQRDAENYGIADAKELLGRIEPYLLDIANLENDSAPDKVLDIKERVKNQSIIASLQIY